MGKLEEHQQLRREAKALLEGFWPSAFSFRAPKPLKIGILDEMVIDAASRGLPFDHAVLKEAVKRYTLCYGYQRALFKCAERYGLQGEVAGEVTDEQRTRAKGELKRRDNKKRLSVRTDVSE